MPTRKTSCLQPYARNHGAVSLLSLKALPGLAIVCTIAMHAYASPQRARRARGRPGSKRLAGNVAGKSSGSKRGSSA
eukprot:7229047-Prymnesium_polylepis.1